MSTANTSPSAAPATELGANGHSSHETIPAHILARAPLKITRDEARLLSVASQRLDRRPPERQKRSKQMLLDTIRAIGCIQLDTISVISRSHETVLWSRVGPYDPALLNALHYPDGHLFEYWLHAAALAPIEHFPHVRRSMAALKERDSWAREHRHVLNRVLAHANERGIVASRDFDRADGPPPEAWAWYGGKPERAALDSLWSNGELMVLKREGFQRFYAPTEQVLPGALHAELPTIEEQNRWFVERALYALGVATPKWVADYFRRGTPHVVAKEAAAILSRLSAEGKAVPVTIDGFKEPTWIGAKEIDLLDRLRDGAARPNLTTLLSPFDSLIWHRGRAADLFGFDYVLEIYVPAPKRRYGYYNLAILHKGNLVGRLDPSYDRRARVLTVRALHLEPTVKPTDRLAAAIAWSLRDLLTFLGGQDIGVLVSDPPQFAGMVQTAIEAGS